MSKKANNKVASNEANGKKDNSSKATITRERSNINRL